MGEQQKEAGMSDTLRDDFEAIYPSDAAEADRKDAERYRWLRKDGNGFHFDGNADVGRFEVKQKTEPGTAIYHRGENLDAAIDTARASQEKA